MKDFDMEAARRGAAVCTRAGHPVRIIAYDGKWLDRFILIVLVEYGGREVSRNYRLCGSAYADDGTDSDLMMRDDDYLEKLERGEYGNHIVDANEMVEPTCNEPIPPDREYWRRVYAGQAMQGIASVLGMNASIAKDIVANEACELADALIAELEKTGTYCSKGSRFSADETDTNS